MPDSDRNSSSRDGDWLEAQIEGLEALKNGLTNTILEVYALMRGPLKVDRGPLYDIHPNHHLQGSDVRYGTLAPMPDLHFHQTILQNQVTPTYALFGSSTIRKTEREIYEYLGFLQVHGKWVDPESEMAMFTALKGHPDVTNLLLPGIDSSSGPYILSQSEQSVVYAEFVDDEDDDEGDPRASRISPETFAKWAEGAVKVEQLQLEVIKQPIQVRRGPRRRSKEHAKLTVFIPQCCAETGLYMSPAYSVDEDPIPLLSPQGINMEYYPMMFSYSYPLEALKFKRAQYFDAGVTDGIPAPSGSEHITSECVREALTVDGDPESGIRQMNEVTDYINQLLQDCQAKAQEAFVAKKIRNKLETEVDQLRSSTHLLRNRVTNMVEQARQASQRRRIREHLKCYIEMLTHRRARLEINVEKLHKKNENLCEQREKYTAERLDLRNTITTLRGFEKLDSC